MYDIDEIHERDEVLVEKVVQWIERYAIPYHRAEVHGMERVADGPALYVANHSGGAYTVDSLIFGAAVYRAAGLEAVPYGLGHEVALQLPFVHDLIMRLGAIRAGHNNAHKLFAAGHRALVYPGGDLDNLRPFRDRHKIVFGGRTGYIRLAVKAGVPIIPVISAGSQSTWLVLSDNRWLAKLTRIDKLLRVKALPLSLTFPWGLSILPIFPYVPFPAKIKIEILDPIEFSRCGEDAANDQEYVRHCATRVEEAMQSCLDRLSTGLL